MGNGQEAMSNGQRAIGDGRWAMSNGVKPGTGDMIIAKQKILSSENPERVV